MKSKGIKFYIMSENDAKDFLSYKTYYFKLKSYAKSFQKMNSCDAYLNLDFAYLVELSTLDAHMRQFIMDNISNLTSPSRISNMLSEKNISTNHVTIGKYIKYLCNAFVFYDIKRYDIRGKKYLESTEKFY